LGALLAALALLVPATALACGPYIPQDGDLEVRRERGMVIWDGATEHMLMELSVSGDASEAAWLFPSPAPATVELGDSAALDELDDLTRPRRVVEHRPAWPFFGLGAGAGAPEGALVGSVQVLSQQTLGPFEVTSLAADEEGALLAWLTENGYSLPEELAAVLRPYVEQGWYYVAVRLAPAAEGESLAGQLEPLWLSFAAAEPVYTMRASAVSHEAYPLTLYVFGEHRVEKEAAFGFSEVPFAGWVDPASLAAGSTLAGRLPGRMFLTKFSEEIYPAEVNDDYVFRFAAEDAEYHETITEVVYDDYTWVGVAGVLCCGLLLAALAGGGVLLARRRRAAA
jgi:hypothetical protein